MRRTIEAIALGIIIAVAYALMLSYVLADSAHARDIIQCNVSDDGRTIRCHDCHFTNDCR